MAVAPVPVIIFGHQFCFEHLNLQRHRQASARTAAALPNKHFTGHAAGPDRLSLQDPKVEYSLRVQFQAGLLPQGVGGLSKRLVIGPRAQGHPPFPLRG